MEGIVIFVFIGIAVLSMLAVLWYLFQTVRIMWAYNSLLAIASVFFSPIIHIIFYFMPKDNFDKHEAGLFKRYFLSIGLIALLGVVAGVVIPTTQVQNSIKSIGNGEVEAQENVMVQDSPSDEELARQGDVHAQWRLGQMYYNGEGVRQDYTKAKEWVGKACDNGLQIGCDKYRELN